MHMYLQKNVALTSNEHVSCCSKAKKLNHYENDNWNNMLCIRCKTDFCHATSIQI